MLKGAVTLSSQALPISEAKARFSELSRKAGMGIEVISANKHGSGHLVSLIKTDILTVALDALHFTLVESLDGELGVITLAVQEIPIYGEGHTRDEAGSALIDAALDYVVVYEERIELFSYGDSPKTQGLMLKLLRCRGDREAIKKTLGL